MQGNLSEILQGMGRQAGIPGVRLAIDLLQELLIRIERSGDGCSWSGAA